MGIYSLKVATGNALTAGTCNSILIVLVGLSSPPKVDTEIPEAQNLSDPQSSPAQPASLPITLSDGTVAEFDINVNKDLGEILLIRVSMERYLCFPLDEWLCQYVHVTSPSGQIYQFPFYQWISKFMAVEIPEGKGVIITGKTHSALKHQRQIELEKNRETYKWKVYAEGVPNCVDVANDEIGNLPPNDQFSMLKGNTINFHCFSGFEFALKGFTSNLNSWHTLEDIKLASSLGKTHNSDIVSEIWKEDSFFGSQYLNGINPTQIRKCFKIPENFPVHEHMVAPSLGTSTNLNNELQDGNIYLADYEILDKMTSTNIINGKPQYITAPLCLLWKNPQDQLVPIAIQLSQTPGVDAPVFLPTDSENDWLLAKIWVRNADYQVHEVDAHFLRTHLLAEVFTIATFRQLPMGHPVYKLIIPHFRYTLGINILARKHLIGPEGYFDQAVVVDNRGIKILLKKAMERVTYSSLCLPDNIKSRNMESIPNYLYRDDGMKIWSAVESFVCNIVNHYYTRDEMVGEDPELQAWVAEIYREGFLQNKSSGVPSCLESKASLIKYLTMLIFTCSAQHSAVNNGQFDYYSWMPNGPTSMNSPPPKAKCVTTMDAILKALPDVNTTAHGILAVWPISKETLDKRCLGNYPDVRFTENTIQKFIKEFQDTLAEISTFIQKRNKTMRLPYDFLDPSMMENSVAI
ncbi:hydroperoxide isomerase ALOXE3-like [Pyxicephalus adspersus]|uniref:hydroperoxide isomerase ALOXE3-like n=1 Tax=Pyxicephalus adspersus TaxID=30357 RepID=UPI003B5CA7F5